MNKMEAETSDKINLLSENLNKNKLIKLIINKIIEDFDKLGGFIDGYDTSNERKLGDGDD